MLDWIMNNSGIISTVGFFTAFVLISLWAYMPYNKKRLQEQANIPFHEEQKNG